MRNPACSVHCAATTGKLFVRGANLFLRIVSSYTECGQELWHIACQWVWNLRLSRGQTLQEGERREIEWAPPKEAPPYLVAEENPPEEYGPWPWAAAFGRATGRFGADAFTLQVDGKLRCPAGASLWLSEVRA